MTRRIDVQCPMRKSRTVPVGRCPTGDSVTGCIFQTMGKRLYALIFAGLFGINLTIGASDASCVSPTPSGHAVMSKDTGSSKSMGGMDMSESNPSNHADAPKPCEQTRVPVGCVLAAGCTSTPLVISFTESRTVTRIPASYSTLELIAPASLRTTPEPPPPRT